MKNSIKRIEIGRDQATSSLLKMKAELEKHKANVISDEEAIKQLEKDIVNYERVLTAIREL